MNIAINEALNVSNTSCLAAENLTRDSKDGEFETSEKEITFLMGNSDIADYTHQEVEVYVAEDDGEYTVLAVKAAKKTETFVLVSDDIKSVTNNRITYYVDSINSSKTKTITIDAKPVVEFNKTTRDKDGNDLDFNYFANKVKEDDIIFFCI